MALMDSINGLSLMNSINGWHLWAALMDGINGQH
jgi:hypothetical protein